MAANILSFVKNALVLDLVLYLLSVHNRDS